MSKECCEAMALVLSRVRATDRLGIMREQLLMFRTSRFTTRLVARIHSSKNEPGSFVELNYCPFCGKRVNNARTRAVSKPVEGSAAPPPKGTHPTHRARRQRQPSAARNRG